jgi:ADP-heptose:LPS heptosyltransferase
MSTSLRPRRIAFVKPCCTGDVVFATALLEVIHRAYPNAALDWFIADSSADVLRGHPAITRLIQTGPDANPARTVRGLIRFVQTLRRGHYDLLLVPDRSVLLSLAAWLTGIRWRVGLDSAGRGFGYTLRAPIDPDERRHEATIYLDLARVLGLPTAGQWTAIYPPVEAAVKVRQVLTAHGIRAEDPLLLAHPGGGVNPGMTLIAKRWPVDRLAALLDRLIPITNATVIALGSSNDKDLTLGVVQSVTSGAVVDLAGALSLSEIGALAALPQVRLYIGNDTGATHLAAAVGAPVLAVFGPSDPVRYRPFAPPDRAAYAWRPVPLATRGVSAQPHQPPSSFNWTRDGISTEEALALSRPLLRN